MKADDKLYGCGCKKKPKGQIVQPESTPVTEQPTQVSTETIPVVITLN